MAENLPLIPEKQSALCADVQSVLRDVFREMDYLPPLVSEPLNRDDLNNCRAADPGEKWIEDYTSECRELYNQEELLKQEFARRLAKEPLPNIYKLESPGDSYEEDWKKERGIVGRRHLKPSIEQDAGRDTNLWVKNTLNRSSGDLREEKVNELPKPLIFPLKAPDKRSLQSLSIGSVVARPAPRALTPAPPAPEPETIVCVPPEINFVNFTVGQLHTQTLRLVNVTKFEVRVSVRPPERRELDVELRSRLAVTAGAAGVLRVRFRPRDVRELRARLQLRVSAGREIYVPINCYMEPPALDIQVPCLSSSRSSSVDDNFGISDVLDLGAKLLGEIHRTPLVLHCDTSHAAFFLVSEDAWIHYVVDVSQINNDKAPGKPIGAASDSFWITPVHWAGGGTVPGQAVCRANAPGLHTTVYRVLCSTAIVRTLQLVADALMFKPDHVVLQAHEKDYDICSPDDRGCENYVNLGVAFPNRPLAATVHIINNSPITYEYYWSTRRWGVCSCWEITGSAEGLVGEEELCPGAPKPASEDESTELASYRNVRAVSAAPANGKISPRATVPVLVQVPDVGTEIGVQRAVLMLVLKGIPKESFVSGIDMMIMKTNIVEEEPIPGVSEGGFREMCDIVVAQMEVWWTVTPVCFMVDQPLLILPRSRRVKSVKIPLEATQLTGVTGVTASWKIPGLNLPPVQLRPGESILTNIQLPLSNPPDEYPETKIFQLEAEHEEWWTVTRLITGCHTRHPALRPAAAWLGLRPPGNRVATELVLQNDTLQHMYWWGSSWRWWHENPVGKACAGRAPCPRCRETSCSCALLRPARGALGPGEEAVLRYEVYAPETDGCVATLIQARRTAPDAGRVAPRAGTAGRAALVAYRVLAPRVVLRILACSGDKHGDCEGCAVDEGGRRSERGTSVLRPRAALTAGRRACYRLRCTNLTPLPTALRWEPPIEGGDVLKVTFIPNDVEIGSHATVDIQVVVEPLKVCGRRIFVLRAVVQHAYKPVYLLIDTAIKGLEVTIEMPLGGEEETDSFVIMRRLQKEEYPWETAEAKSFTVKEWFAEDDKKRKIQKENICHCRYKMVYIPAKKPLKKPPMEPNASDTDHHSIEIVSEPPSLTRVCPCGARTKPALPEDQEPLCLQFWNLPIRTVRSRKVTIRNLYTITTNWSTAVRRWPRRHRRTIAADQWASDVREPGVAVECKPAAGALTSRGHADISVRAYADCWGLYMDQILIQIDNLEPIIVDVWVEAVGSPLQFAANPGLDIPLLWMSTSDPERTLKVTNTSRADLVLRACVLQEHGHPQDALPFRLYIRFYDIPPRTCPCLDTPQSDTVSEEDTGSSIPEEVDTAIELFLAADYGIQNEDHYEVEPAETVVGAGCDVPCRVRLRPAPLPAPPCVLLLRTSPVHRAGDSWHRPAPAPRRVLLRVAPRCARLQLSSGELRVAVCALDLPRDDVMRIRKTIQVHNVGNGPLHTTLVSSPPWRTVAADGCCRARCGFGPRERRDVTQLQLPPHSTVELCTEVSLRTGDVWPPPGQSYEPQRVTTTQLYFRDENQVTLMSLPLILELDLPVIRARPPSLDFGYVTEGDSRKDYVTVTHSSRTARVELVAKMEDCQDFQVWPPSVILEAGESANIYVQYSARRRSSPAAGRLVVAAAGGARAWCSVVVAVRARPTRDHVYHGPPRDHTDDKHLLPPDLAL